MTDSEKDKLDEYFQSLKEMDAEKLMSRVDSYLDDEAIEIFVEHIEEFYGIEDDEQLGMLAQIMVSGFVAAKEISNSKDQLLS
jgi:hypothetical protein